MTIQGINNAVKQAQEYPENNLDEYLRLSLDLNTDFERTTNDIFRCAYWLAKYGKTNGMTISELRRFCFENELWVFEQVF